MLKASRGCLRDKGCLELELSGMEVRDNFRESMGQLRAYWLVIPGEDKSRVDGSSCHQPPTSVPRGITLSKAMISQVGGPQ